MFARRGFDATSLAIIAAEVGVTKPSLLYHFPSKEELRAAVLEGLVGHWTEAIPRLLAAVSRGEDRFRAVTEEMIGFFERDPDRARLIVRELLDRPKEMKTQLGKRVRPWVQMLGDSIRSGQRAGEIEPCVDPESYVMHTMTLVIAAIAASDVLGELLRGEGGKREAKDRGRRELLRIAKSSLFSGSTTTVGS